MSKPTDPLLSNADAQLPPDEPRSSPAVPALRHGQDYWYGPARNDAEWVEREEARAASLRRFFDGSKP
jgi:hypothetical protein